MSETPRNRRDFLEALKPQTDDGGSPVAIPVGGSTVRVATRAMACEFSVIMNPGTHERVAAVGDVLELIHDIERWLSIYKPASEISHVNQQAAGQAVHVRRQLFDLLQTSQWLHTETSGAFDIASGAQIQLWRNCRSQQRIPTEEERADVLQRSGTQHMHLEEKSTSVRFDTDGLLLNPGAIGKGYAIDEASAWLKKTEGGPTDFLLHGGHSSLFASGSHADLGGWPVGIGNPLFTNRRLGTILLIDQAMSTSGSNIQYFRHQGRRYGHILDPRTAMPVDEMLSVTVFADSAAVADALSTAFFVLGLENARKCCDNLPGVGAILIPFPQKGRKVSPTMIRVPEARVFWDEEQVSL